MKKFFKALALVLALALVVGVVPAQTASAKIKAKKTLYVDGAQGTSKDGKTKSSYKEKVALYKLAGDKKADKDDHTYTATIKSGKDVVSVSKKYVTAEALGKAVVEITRDGESLGTTAITVKKNADAETLKLVVKEGDEFVKVTAETKFVAGVTYRFALPRTKADTDERRLFVDDKAVEDVKDLDRQYDVVFEEGKHTIVFEAFQSETLDAATAEDKVTITAKAPQALEAKQVSANSFKVTFDSAMKVNGKDLIDKDKVNNQDIYYLIAKQPVVTGVIKSVEVSKDDPTVVVITMYAALNSSETYYFQYGDGEPVSFKTAVNSRAAVASIVIDDSVTYYVDSPKAISYKLFNADGVELNIADEPTFEPVSTSGSTVAYVTGKTVTFWEEGTFAVKATFDTGEYDESEGKYVTVTTTATLTGSVKAAAAVASKKYSFNGTIDDQVHTLRMGDETHTLSVYYKYDDNSEATVVGDTTPGIYLQSTDETKVVIAGGKLIPVSVGNATIVLYSAGSDGIVGNSDDYVVDAFPIQILEKQVGKTATATLSKNTLNLNGSLTEADGTTAYNDKVQIKYSVKNLDGKDYTNYTVEIKQVDGNQASTGITLVPTTKANEAYFVAGDFTGYNTFATSGYKVVRFTVTIKDAGNNSKVLATTTLSITIANIAEDQADAWKVRATANTLDTSVKDWSTTTPDKDSVVQVFAVKNSSYGEFACGTEAFTEVASVANIPTTSSSQYANFVIKSVPSSGTQITTATGAAGTYSYTIKSFGNIADMHTTRTKDGSYTFTGYHIEYNTTGAKDIKTKSQLGSASVVVSHSDASASFTVLKGTVEALTDAAPAIVAPTTSFSTPGYNGTDKDTFADAGVLKITWAGLNNISNPDRVYIKTLNYVVDTTTGAIVVKNAKVIVKPHVNAAGVAQTPQDEITVTINTLFKDN